MASITRHLALLLSLCLAFALHLANGQGVQTGSWTATFEPINITMHMHTEENITLHLAGVDRAVIIQSGAHFRIVADNPKLLVIEKTISAAEISAEGTWSGQITLDALFIGLTSAYVELVSGETTMERSANTLPVVIIREVRTIDHVFTGSVATLVSILYINFGAALNLKNLKSIIRRPIGPAIGFFGQFLIMPLVRKLKKKCILYL